MGQNPERLEIGHCAGLVRVTWRRYLYTGGGRPACRALRWDLSGGN